MSGGYAGDTMAPLEPNVPLHSRLSRVERLVDEWGSTADTTDGSTPRQIVSSAWLISGALLAIQGPH